jgi:hypothetical protein
VGYWIIHSKQVEINMRIRVLIVTFLVVLVANSVAAIGLAQLSGTLGLEPARTSLSGSQCCRRPENGDGQRFDGLGGSITIYGGYNFTGSFSGYRSFLKQTLRRKAGN